MPLGQILLVPPQKPPWEQNPLAPFGGVPREKREQKTEDFIVYLYVTWNMPRHQKGEYPATQ
jgi:hypothetical protein